MQCEVCDSVPNRPPCAAHAAVPAWQVRATAVTTRHSDLLCFFLFLWQGSSCSQAATPFACVLAGGERSRPCVQVLEKSEVVREGKDCVILTYSRMRWTVMQAVGELEKQVCSHHPLTCMGELDGTSLDGPIT